MPALRSLRRKAKARVSATPASARLSTATPLVARRGAASPGTRRAARLARALTRIGDPAAALFIESPGDHAVGVDRISSWGSVTVSARLRISPPLGRPGSVLARSSMTMAA